MSTCSAPSYYLRVEGVNLTPFVFDTRNLSTIRGAGLLLLRAAGDVEELLAGLADPVRRVSSGASIGLFAFTPREGFDADTIRQRVEEHLRLHDNFRHATFVVDIVPATADVPFKTSLEKTLARNRWRQMRSASLAVPAAAAVQAPPGGAACHLDGLRPAETRYPGPGQDNGPTFLSAATANRRDYGNDQKQRFYERLTLRPIARKFAREFEDIAHDSAWGSLHGKLAVFYADGNSFSKIQALLCTSEKNQIAWDEHLRALRKDFLASFVEGHLQTKKGWVSRDGAYRFETLLWGGDEFLFVMPAWKGWGFAEFFFEHTGSWSTHGAGELALESLTHTAALVFCQHHAPIHRIKTLAKGALAETAKKIGRERHPFGRNQLAYQVLESFDHLGTDLEQALHARYGRAIRFSQLVLLPGQVETLRRTVARLKRSDFPRSQLRAYVGGLLRGTDRRAFEQVTTTLCRTARPDAKTALDALGAAFGKDNPALWIHLEELWDYAAPEA